MTARENLKSIQSLFAASVGDYLLITPSSQARTSGNRKQNKTERRTNTKIGRHQLHSKDFIYIFINCVHVVCLIV